MVDHGFVMFCSKILVMFMTICQDHPLLQHQEPPSGRACRTALICFEAPFPDEQLREVIEASLRVVKYHIEQIHTRVSKYIQLGLSLNRQITNFEQGLQPNHHHPLLLVYIKG